MKPRLPLPGRGQKRTSDKKSGGFSLSFDSRRTGLAITVTVLMSVLLSLHLLPERVTLKAGDISPEEIRAHRSARYLDKEETARKRLEASLSVGRIYDPVPYARDKALENVSLLFNAVSHAKKSSYLRTLDTKLQYVRSSGLIEVKLQDSQLAELLMLSDKQLENLRRFCAENVSEIMRREIRDDTRDMNEAKAAVEVAAGRAYGSSKIAVLAADLCKSFLLPTHVYDAERTESARRRATEAVRPVYSEITAGQVIIRKDEKVTEKHLEQFRALGLQHPKINIRAALSVIAYSAFLVILLSVYLANYQPQIYENIKKLLLLSVVVVIITLVLKFGGALLGIQLSGLQLSYLGTLTVTVAGMLLAVLLNVETAVVVVSLLSVTTGLAMNNEIGFVAMTLVSSLVGIYSVSNIRDRSDLIRSGLAIGIANIGLVWIIGGLKDDLLTAMAFGTGWAAAIGVVSVMVFWPMTAILESLFGVTTHISLLELADTNKPIFKRMVLEAQGTFTHSIVVGQLAEAAAEAIGADPLYSRVAAYYHDIGKLMRPHFFVENQSAGNAHDAINPTLSALVITSHVKDGIEIAKEHKLPQIIQDVILQHHGTSLVHYFYSLVATDQDGRSAMLEQQFRYAGPKPRSRESAIVMLADSVEAATRAIARPTKANIEDTVRRIIEDKRKDGQLDESELTFRDLELIADALCKRLVGILHARIEYPEPPSESNGKRQAEIGDNDQQPAESTDTKEKIGKPGRAPSAS